MKKERKHWKIALICVAALIAAAAGAVGTVFAVNRYSLRMTLAGSAQITLEFGEAYTEMGASAVFSGTLLERSGREVEVCVDGAVDESRVGTYVLTYTAQWRGYTASQQRMVRVVDTCDPVITLVADPDGYTLPGHPYAEEGFSATDNYDGDLTDKVKRTVEDDRIVYTVSDSSGNTATVTRGIVYDDRNAPTVTLAGAQNIRIKPGQAYEESGFQAVDDLDGDLTEQVQVTGEVDIYTPGDYPYTYTVTDAHGNTGEAVRTVTVEAYDIKGIGGVIYLTFDDGPSDYTATLLDILAKYQVKATFFVTNYGNAGAMRRAAAEGHTVAIHSATHNYSQIYASEEAYFADLYKMQSIIQSYTGTAPTLLRFPGGSSNTVSCFNPGIMTRLAEAVHEKGFEYFDWNVSSGDAGIAQSTNEVYYRVISGVSNYHTAIVLQHDTHYFSVMAVEKIIQWGLANGYTFLPLTMGSPTCHHNISN